MTAATTCAATRVRRGPSSLNRPMVTATDSAAASTAREMATPNPASQRGPPDNVNTSMNGEARNSPTMAMSTALAAMRTANSRRGLTGDDSTRSRSPRE